MMFNPDVNLIIVGGAFVSIAFVAWQAHKTEKRSRVLITKNLTLKLDKSDVQSNLEREKKHSAQLEEENENLRGTLGDFHSRINRALVRAAQHPNTRPGAIVDILSGES